MRRAIENVLRQIIREELISIPLDIITPYEERKVVEGMDAIKRGEKISLEQLKNELENRNIGTSKKRDRKTAKKHKR